MRIGFLLSGLLHLGLIALTVFGLPRWTRPVPLDQQVIPFQIIAEVAERRSVPTEKPDPPDQAKPPPPPESPSLPESAAPEPAPVKTVEPPPPPVEVAKAEPIILPPPEPKPAKLPEPPPPEPAPPKVAKPAPRPPPLPKAKPKPPPKPTSKAPPKPKPKPSPKPKPKPKPEPKAAAKKPIPPKPDDFLNRMRRAVSKHEVSPPQVARVAASRSRLADQTQRLTMNEEDAVRRHIIGCWNPPVGARGAQDMEVRIIGKLRRDGVVENVRLVDGDRARASADEYFRTFAESAMRAFYKCERLPLPPHKYESWKTFNIGFNLKDMLGE